LPFEPIINYTIRKLVNAAVNLAVLTLRFATINGGNMTRPRAADDFAVIRARMEELRRERAQVSTERDARPLGPRPYHSATSVLENGRQRRLSLAVRRKLFG
jgi:hypothetical protein